MKIRIRLATVADIDRILPLMKELYEYAGFSTVAAFDEQSVGKFTARLISSPTAEILVADTGAELIGLASFVVDSPYYNWEHRVASGISFWVEPEYRKMGVGQKLYEASELLATRHGCAAVTLGVMVEDKYLAEYHERNGFKNRELLFYKEIN